ncbi:DUF6624 domain-containing protein [Maricaulis sp.]|uniref:DUF6624 domain-containing protein n=1 Tax=Maricaulis sp. TaxID=1486257 RepID=UPI002621BE2D|nr:DUF6624 domain-containing protein [Maricaulis sp.]
MGLNTIVLAAGAALIAAVPASAFAQVQVMQGQERPAEMIERINAGYDAEAAAIAAFDCADNDRACLSEELIERYRVDQWSRGLLHDPQAICGDYFQTHMMPCLQTLMGTITFKGDIENQARLKEIVALHGWPSPPEFSGEAQNAAWYIAQHGQYFDEEQGMTQWDADFAGSILPLIREAVEREELTPWHYAAMYDRRERAEGRPQRYATQIMCSEGRADFGEVVDETRIDEFRAEIGMDALNLEGYHAHCADGAHLSR